MKIRIKIPGGLRNSGQPAEKVAITQHNSVLR